MINAGPDYFEHRSITVDKIGDEWYAYDHLQGHSATASTASTALKLLAEMESDEA